MLPRKKYRPTVKGYKYLSEEEKKTYHRDAMRRTYEHRKANGLTVAGKAPVGPAKIPDHKPCSVCQRLLPNDKEHFYTVTSSLKQRCSVCAKAYAKGWRLTAEEAQFFQDAIAKSVCWICERTTNLIVDHCHTDGHARGILCLTCNGVLGFLRDDPVLFDRAASYLRQTTRQK